jgi:transposase
MNLEQLMQKMPAAEPTPVEPELLTTGKTGKRQRRKASKNQPDFATAAELKRMTGVGLTRIDGIQPMTVRTVITEAGLDMSQWPAEHHFVSWIGLAPILST